MELVKIVYCMIFLMVGIITFSISLRFLLSKEFFTYHSEATGMKWKDLNESLQIIILAIMKMAGFGILCLSITIIIYSFFIFSNNNNIVIRYLIPIISLIFWCGSFGTTFSVYKKTKANTPWKGSLLSMILIIIAILISLIFL